MNKPNFESEEEFDDFISACMPAVVSDVSRELIKKYAKKRGYIKQSVAEEAKELYSLYNPNDEKAVEHHILIERQHDAIQYLEEQLNKR